MRLDRKMKISFPEQIRTGKIIDYSPDSYIVLTCQITCPDENDLDEFGLYAKKEGFYLKNKFFENALWYMEFQSINIKVSALTVNLFYYMHGFFYYNSEKFMYIIKSIGIQPHDLERDYY